jgi:hypothetical protein
VRSIGRSSGGPEYRPPSGGTGGRADARPHANHTRVGESPSFCTTSRLTRGFDSQHPREAASRQEQGRVRSRLARKQFVQ